VNVVTTIDYLSVAQDAALPLSNAWDESPPPEPKRKKRLSGAKLTTLVVEVMASPRSPEAALAALKASRPDISLPRHIVRDLKVVSCVRRLHALGVEPAEVLSWLERF
jgi:hypothetical protein